MVNELCVGTGTNDDGLELGVDEQEHTVTVVVAPTSVGELVEPSYELTYVVVIVVSPPEDVALVVEGGT